MGRVMLAMAEVNRAVSLVVRWAYPSLLSAPVTLTLSLSRRAGEGMCHATRGFL